VQRTNQYGSFFEQLKQFADKHKVGTVPPLPGQIQQGNAAAGPSKVGQICNYFTRV
jgi:hypothetical protein